MPPRKAQPGPPELFSGEHACEFEILHGLPTGSVAHAYRNRFGHQAPYVLSDLINQPPTVDKPGNIIWPPPPTLRRRGAVKRSSKPSVEVASVSSTSGGEEDEEDELPHLGPGPGLKRSNAIRRKRVTSAPVEKPSNLRRSGAVRKGYNPVTARKPAPEPSGPASGVRKRSLRSGKGSMSSRGSKGSPDRMEF